MNDLAQPEIKYELPNQEGEWILVGSYVSELDYLMARFYHPERKVFLTYNLGLFEKLINQIKINRNGI